MPTAIVTGASAGIGEAFARRLAAAGNHLVLVARRRERLDALATDLSRAHRVNVRVEAADLTRPEDLERLAAMAAADNELAYLVNNAGFGVPGEFAANDAAGQMSMVALHVTATTRLTHAALQTMKPRGQGAIINVASLAGLVLTPGSAVYCASKAYIVWLCRGLHEELMPTGVHVQALCPGFTHTEFHDRPGYEKIKTGFPEFLWQSPAEVVEESLRALPRNEPVVVTGTPNRLMRVVAGNAAARALMRRFR